MDLLQSLSKINELVDLISSKSLGNTDTAISLMQLSRTLTTLAEEYLENPPSEENVRVRRLSGPTHPLSTLMDRAFGIYTGRRLRDRFFDNMDIFGEPAWDILLDLFSAEASGKFTSVTSACLASAVPATTGLRWIAVLEQRGLIEREDDDLDRRRSHVKLTQKGRASLVNYFGELANRGL